MKIFVVNLATQPEKKTKFINEWDGLEGNLEFIDAVDGRTMTDEALSNLTLDYPNLHLTKGEIGCALSHLKIYKKIVEEEIPLALILEDDVCLAKGIDIKTLNHLLQRIEISDLFDRFNSPVIFLQKHNSRLARKVTTILQFDFCSTKYMWGTFGYIVSFNAAKKLCQFIPPIRYEADCWEAHQVGASLQLVACSPYVIDTYDDNREFSTIEKERALLIQKRKTARESLLLKELGVKRKIGFFPINRFIKKVLLPKIKKMFS